MITRRKGITAVRDFEGAIDDGDALAQLVLARSGVAGLSNVTADGVWPQAARSAGNRRGLKSRETCPRLAKVHHLTRGDNSTAPCTQ
jgi:hypothetical protein